MADNDDTDKTEDPTQKRLAEAVKSGDVAKRPEGNTWYMLAGATLAIAVFGGSSATKLALLFQDFLGGLGQLSEGFSYRGLAANLMVQVMLALAPLMGILILAALAGNYVQHGPLWTVEALAPKLSRLSPLNGVKRIF